MKKSWIIKRIGGNKPKVVHSSLQDACAELKRLCELNSDNVYVLYEAIGYAKVRTGQDFATIREINGEQRGKLFTLSNAIEEDGSK